jgi:hypothetical protein
MSVNWNRIGIVRNLTKAIIDWIVENAVWLKDMANKIPFSRKPGPQ